MTAAVRLSPAWLPSFERFRREGGTLTTARISISGQVKLHTVRATARFTHQGYVELWPTDTREQVIGTVDPFAADAWRTADRLLHAAGWCVVDGWTTVDRMPCARVVRANQTPRGRSPRAKK